MSRLLDAPRREPVPDDRAAYFIGTVSSAVAGVPHEVVLTLMPEAGTDAAATACTNLVRSFRSVNCAVMAGIACGVPNPREPERHVRLGDVVVGAWGVVDYDHVDETSDGPRRRGGFPKPSALLNGAANLLRAKEQLGDRPWKRGLDVSAWPKLAEYRRPPEHTDVLHATEDPNARIPHPDPARTGHRPGLPKVHYGLIGSANRSLRNARVRDELAARHNLLAFEMEGTGIGNGSFPIGLEWFVVRGISDYGDERATNVWRHYAALAAAAYTRALLGECAPLEPRGGQTRGSRPADREDGDSKYRFDELNNHGSLAIGDGARANGR